MNKPIYLRVETWDYLVSKLNGLSTNYKYRVIAQPGSFLLRHDLLSQPDLLENTVIEELDDGPEYLITQQAAKELANGADCVTLLRLYDHHEKTMTRPTLIKSIRRSSTFDQLDKRT